MFVYYIIQVKNRFYFIIGVITGDDNEVKNQPAKVVDFRGRDQANKLISSIDQGLKRVACGLCRRCLRPPAFYLG